MDEEKIKIKMDDGVDTSLASEGIDLFARHLQVLVVSSCRKASQ